MEELPRRLDLRLPTAACQGGDALPRLPPLVAGSRQVPAAVPPAVHGSGGRDGPQPQRRNSRRESRRQQGPVVRGDIVKALLLLPQLCFVLTRSCKPTAFLAAKARVCFRLREKYKHGFSFDLATAEMASY